MISLYYNANFSDPTHGQSTSIWPQLGDKGEYMILGPRPTPSTGFYPKAATIFACTIPAIEGYNQTWCQ
jgi:hypothetical protein